VFQALAAGTSGSTAPRQLVVYWAVYDNSGNQLNLFGLGNIANDRVSVPLVSFVGGRFPPTSSSGRTEQAFGTVDITFTGCNTATANVQPTRAGFSATTLNLSRLTPVESLPCTFFSSGQIDRMGRPGINTALIDLLASTGKKDAYNRAESRNDWTQFQSEMQSNLTALDTLDGVTGNTLLPPATAASVFVDDRLQVNTSAAACGPYLAVELNVSGQCGGRTLERDVIDDTLGAVVGPGVSDNVGNDSTFLADFPFLGVPQQ